MKKKTNKKFDAKYRKLEMDCCAKFGIVEGGVAEYLNRLNNLNFAPDRDKLIPQLTRIQAIASNPDGSYEARKADVKWVAKFDKAVCKKKDSLSVYLKQARKYVKGVKAKKFWTALVWILLILILLAAGYVVTCSFVESLPLADKITGFFNFKDALHI